MKSQQAWIRLKQALLCENISFRHFLDLHWRCMDFFVFVSAYMGFHKTRTYFSQEISRVNTNASGMLISEIFFWIFCSGKRFNSHSTFVANFTAQNVMMMFWIKKSLNKHFFYQVVRRRTRFLSCDYQSISAILIEFIIIKTSKTRVFRLNSNWNQRERRGRVDQAQKMCVCVVCCAIMLNCVICK